jgi:hypothetical protein
MATLDGLVVLVMAGTFALLAALGRDVVGAVIGLLIAGAGAMELHGVALLRQEHPRGVNWLTGSQVFLLLSILTYCALQLIYVQVPVLPDSAVPLIELNAQQFNMGRDEFLIFLQRTVYVTFGLISFFYQGSMALFYYRRRDAVRQALQ